MSVILIHGRNTVDVEERLADLVVTGDPQGLNSTVLSLEQADAGQFEAAISTPGFFGAGRIVVLKGVPGVDRSSGVEWDEIEKTLVNQPATTTTILATTQRIPANRKSIKVAKAEGWRVELYDLLFGRELEAWVAARATATGVEFARGAIPVLLSRLYPTAWQREDRWNPQTIDMRMIATEVEKLAAGSVDGAISIENVEELVIDRAGITAFKLNDDTFEGHTERALVELEVVLANGEAPERVVGQLGYQPAVLQASRWVQRYGVDTVAQASGISAGQLKATVSRKTSWRNEEGLQRASESLRRSEWLVKTGRSPNTESVLTPLVAEISEGFRR